MLLIILCLFLPFLAVLIKDGPSMKVLWAFLLQLCGHIPGVIYGIYQVVPGLTWQWLRRQPHGRGKAGPADLIGGGASEQSGFKR